MRRHIAKSHENYITPAELEIALINGLIVKSGSRFFAFTRLDGLLAAASIGGPWTKSNLEFSSICRPSLSFDSASNLERIMENP